MTRQSVATRRYSWPRFWTDPGENIGEDFFDRSLRFALGTNALQLSKLIDEHCLVLQRSRSIAPESRINARCRSPILAVAFSSCWVEADCIVATRPVRQGPACAAVTVASHPWAVTARTPQP